MGCGRESYQFFLALPLSLSFPLLAKRGGGAAGVSVASSGYASAPVQVYHLVYAI